MKDRKIKNPSKGSSTGTVLVLDHKHGQVEMLMAANPLFSWALGSCERANILGNLVNAVNAPALVALKVHAMVANPRREAKDRSDVVSVISKNGVEIVDSALKHLNEVEAQLLRKLTLAF